MNAQTAKLILPDEVTPRYLVRFLESPAPIFEKATAFYDSRHYTIDELWKQTRYVFRSAQALRDFQTAALSKLLESDLCRREHDTKAALAAAEWAQSWLALRHENTARYYEGITHYQLGILHYLKCDEPRAHTDLGKAWKLLEEIKQLWHSEGGHPFLQRCTQLHAWTLDLMSLCEEVCAAADKIVIPVYEPEGEELRLVEAIAVSLHQLTTATTDQQSHNVAAAHDDTADILYYFAVRINRDQQYVRESKSGDLVVVQRTSPSSTSDAGPASSKTSPVSTPKREFEFLFPYGEMKGEPRLIIGGEEQR
jgi:hypothetical protein